MSKFESSVGIIYHITTVKDGLHEASSQSFERACRDTFAKWKGIIKK